jgi:hypothetical protein
MFLWKITKARFATAGHGPTRDVLTVEQNFARRRLRETADHVETCRFTRPVRAEETYNFSRINFDVDVVNRRNFSVALGESSRFKHRHIASCHRFPPCFFERAEKKIARRQL